MSKIAHYRKAMGFTQKDMARKFNISRQAYYRKEKGYVPFNDEEKVELVKIFRREFPDLTVESLFFYSEYKEIQRNEV